MQSECEGFYLELHQAALLLDLLLVLCLAPLLLRPPLGLHGRAGNLT